MPIFNILSGAKMLHDIFALAEKKSIKPESAIKMLDQAADIRKATVRPAFTQGCNRGLFAIVMIHGVHALGQMAQLIPPDAVPDETWSNLYQIALLLLGGSGLSYGVRSVEKHRGKA